MWDGIEASYSRRTCSAKKPALQKKLGGCFLDIDVDQQAADQVAD